MQSIDLTRNLKLHSNSGKPDTILHYEHSALSLVKGLEPVKHIA